MSDIEKMYCVEKMSIPEISRITGIARSTIRFRLKAIGVLRNKADAIRAAAEAGKLGGGMRGKSRTFTPEWCARISAGKKKAADLTSTGTSLKPNGYIVYTRGEHKGRSVHVVVMETHIGRRLFNNECVHHKDENKANNELHNLQLMTKPDHARLHALDNLNKRKRKTNGQFE